MFFSSQIIVKHIGVNFNHNSKLGCARTLSEASWLSTREYLLRSSEVWRSIRIPAVAVRKELRTSLR